MDVKLVIRKFLFIKDQTLEVNIKKDKKDKYIGIDVKHTKHNLFSKDIVNKSLYRFFKATDLRNVEVMLYSEGVFSIIIDSKSLFSKTKGFMDAYTYKVNKNIINAVRSDIEVPDIK